MSASDSVSPNLYADVLAASHAARRSASRSSFLRAVFVAEIVTDALITAGGYLAACIATPIIGQPASPLGASAAGALALALLVGFLLHHDGARHHGSGLLRIRGTEDLLRRAWQGIFLFAIMAPLLGVRFPAAVIIVSAVIIPAALIGKAQILFSILQRHTPTDRAMIYGAGESARAVVSILRNSPSAGLVPIAVIEDEARDAIGGVPAMDYRPGNPVPILAGPVTPTLLQSAKCKVLIVAGSNLRRDTLEQAMRAARDAGLATAIVDIPPALDQQNSIQLDELTLHTSKAETAPIDPIGKRALDLLGSGLLLIALAPLLLMVAALICLDSPGPALFIQERAGRDGRLFRMYKFRSMHADSLKYAYSPASSADPRITRIGRLLRRWSIDELPQLINVFLGDMSLVGPRPEMPFIVESYAAEQRQRLQVLPGITGLWQLSADRAFPIHKNLEYDLYYIRNRTLFMDIAILVHTLLFGMRRGV